MCISLSKSNGRERDTFLRAPEYASLCACSILPPLAEEEEGAEGEMGYRSISVLNSIATNWG